MSFAMNLLKSYFIDPAIQSCDTDDHGNDTVIFVIGKAYAGRMSFNKSTVKFVLAAGRWTGKGTCNVIELGFKESDTSLTVYFKKSKREVIRVQLTGDCIDRFRRLLNYKA